MAGTKSSEADQSETEVQASVQGTEPSAAPAPASAPDFAGDIATLSTKLEGVLGRLARVEQAAHPDHALGAEELEQIMSQVMEHVHDFLQKALGHSGLPSA